MIIQYLGEHLSFGKAGQLAVIISFVAALAAAVAYFLAAKGEVEDLSWKRFARGAFALHAAAVLSIFGILFYVIYNHYFEYYYVWHHSSLALPMHYILACFWEGQEGSFLLWIFWHVVLSFIIIRKAGTWEAPVMTTVSMVQVFLSSMLLGIVVLNYKIGSDPFILLREHPDMAKLPFIKMPDYLSRIADGRGLNPLLQNYWMVIHPPTLFLGFASTLIPFAFAIAGLWKKKYTEWLKPAMPWTFFGVMILGTGILMGGAWAYESLSFGGFWAWDPVENASLVPWLTFVGAAHVMLIQKHGGQTILSSFLLTVTTFLLVLYSTFLTRSGILGNSSVHAFTDLGMSGQLLIYMAFFSVLAIVLLIVNWKKIPTSEQEEHLSAREFWMFIGMLVLLISCLQITFETSKPVYNKVFGTNLAPPANMVDHYNKWQLPIAVVIALLVAITQFFKYKQTNVSEMLKKLIPSVIAATALTVLMAYVVSLTNPYHIALLWSSLWAVCANIDFMFRVLKGRVKFAGASIAHTGFALILAGSLISNGKRQIISHNTSSMDLGKELSNAENVMLTKGDTIPMGEFYLSYKGFKKVGVDVNYEIEYFKMSEAGKLTHQFTLSPILQLNKQMGNAAEPATKHFWNRDVFTHITYVNTDEINDNDNPNLYKDPVMKTIKVGDTLVTSNSLVIVRALNKDVDKTKLQLEPTDLAVAAEIDVYDINKKKFHAAPVFVIRGNTIFPIEADITDLGLKFAFTKINPDNGKIDLAIAEKKSNSRPFIVMKAMIFPYINLVWIGAIIMIIGTLVAVRKRIGELK